MTKAQQQKLSKKLKQAKKTVKNMKGKPSKRNRKRVKALYKIMCPSSALANKD
jgi:acyl-CoA-binding protein